MRAIGNLAGVEFIAVPTYLNYNTQEVWKKIITESAYFFTRDAMKFFGSRVLWETLTKSPNGYYFITSEQHSNPYFGISEPRRYTLREWTEENGTDTVGDFQEFTNIDQAKRALKKLAVKAMVK